MNGIQSFVGGGGAFGQDVRDKKQKEIDRKQLQKDRTGGRGDKSNKEQFEDLQQSNRNRAENFNFAEDLKKLAGPQGSGTFLFTSNPNTKAFMDKYGLDTQDIIDLRLGAGTLAFSNVTAEHASFDMWFDSPNLSSIYEKLIILPESANPTREEKLTAIYGFKDNYLNKPELFANFKRCFFAIRKSLDP